MFDTILFDLDGTLTDPKEGITKSVQYALEKMGVYEPNLENLVRFIGPPLVDSFSEFYGFNSDDAIRAVGFYRERFTNIGIYENRLIDGIPNLLENLKQSGKTIALATSKPHVYASRILDNFDLSDYFDVIVGAEFDGTRNEKKEVIEEVLRQLPDSQSPVMVGDRRQDVIGAKLCDIPCIGVRFGYAEENELENAGADFIASTISDLQNLLNV